MQIISYYYHSYTVTQITIIRVLAKKEDSQKITFLSRVLPHHRTGASLSPLLSRLRIDLLSRIKSHRRNFAGVAKSGENIPFCTFDPLTRNACMFDSQDCVLQGRQKAF